MSDPSESDDEECNHEPCCTSLEEHAEKLEEDKKRRAAAAAAAASSSAAATTAAAAEDDDGEKKGRGKGDESPKLTEEEAEAEMLRKEEEMEEKKRARRQRLASIAADHGDDSNLKWVVIRMQGPQGKYDTYTAPRYVKKLVRVERPEWEQEEEDWTDGPPNPDIDPDAYRRWRKRGKLDDVTRIFRMLDKDDSGVVNKEEMLHALETDEDLRETMEDSPQLAPLLNPEAFAEAFELMDVDDEGTVSLVEFRAFMHDLTEAEERIALEKCYEVEFFVEQCEGKFKKEYLEDQFKARAAMTHKHHFGGDDDDDDEKNNNGEGDATNGKEEEKEKDEKRQQKDKEEEEEAGGEKKPEKEKQKAKPKKPKKKRKDDDIAKIFKLLDKDGEGSIDKEELQHAVRSEEEVAHQSTGGQVLAEAKVAAEKAAARAVEETAAALVKAEAEKEKAFKSWMAAADDHDADGDGTGDLEQEMQARDATFEAATEAARDAERTQEELKAGDWVDAPEVKAAQAKIDAHAAKDADEATRQRRIRNLLKKSILLRPLLRPTAFDAAWARMDADRDGQATLKEFRGFVTDAGRCFDGIECRYVKYKGWAAREDVLIDCRKSDGGSIPDEVFEEHDKALKARPPKEGLKLKARWLLNHHEIAKEAAMARAGEQGAQRRAKMDEEKRVAEVKAMEAEEERSRQAWFYEANRARLEAEAKALAESHARGNVAKTLRRQTLRKQKEAEKKKKLGDPKDLIVRVLACHGLASADGDDKKRTKKGEHKGSKKGGGSSDPYAKISLVAKPKGSAKTEVIGKTDVVQNNCDPVWNEVFEVNLPKVRVKAKCKAGQGGLEQDWLKFYEGEITKDNGDGTYDMKFDDGDEVPGVSVDQMKKDGVKKALPQIAHKSGLAACQLVVEVFDKDPGPDPDDFLGRAVITLDEMIANLNGMPYQHDLVGKRSAGKDKDGNDKADVKGGKKKSGGGKESALVKGKITLAFEHKIDVVDNGKLVVNVCYAESIKCADIGGPVQGGLSDAYCVLKFQPCPSHKWSDLGQTKVISNQKDPVWEEEYFATDFPNLAEHATLVVDMFDKDPGPDPDDFLGNVTLNGNQILQIMGGGHEMSLALKGKRGIPGSSNYVPPHRADKGIKGTLALAFQVIERDESLVPKPPQNDSKEALAKLPAWTKVHDPRSGDPYFYHNRNNNDEWQWDQPPDFIHTVDIDGDAFCPGFSHPRLIGATRIQRRYRVRLARKQVQRKREQKEGGGEGGGDGGGAGGAGGAGGGGEKKKVGGGGMKPPPGPPPPKAKRKKKPPPSEGAGGDGEESKGEPVKGGSSGSSGGGGSSSSSSSAGAGGLESGKEEKGEPVPPPPP